MHLSYALPLLKCWVSQKKSSRTQVSRAMLLLLWESGYIRPIDWELDTCCIDITACKIISLFLWFKRKYYSGFVRVKLDQFFWKKLKNVRLNQFFYLKIWESQFFSVQMLENVWLKKLRNLFKIKLRSEFIL